MACGRFAPRPSLAEGAETAVGLRQNRSEGDQGAEHHGELSGKDSADDSGGGRAGILPSATAGHTRSLAGARRITRLTAWDDWLVDQFHEQGFRANDDNRDGLSRCGHGGRFPLFLRDGVIRPPRRVLHPVCRTGLDTVGRVLELVDRLRFALLGRLARLARRLRLEQLGESFGPVGRLVVLRAVGVDEPVEGVVADQEDAHRFESDFKALGIGGFHGVAFVGHSSPSLVGPFRHSSPARLSASSSTRRRVIWSICRAIPAYVRSIPAFTPAVIWGSVWRTRLSTTDRTHSRMASPTSGNMPEGIGSSFASRLTGSVMLILFQCREVLRRCHRSAGPFASVRTSPATNPSAGGRIPRREYS